MHMHMHMQMHIQMHMQMHKQMHMQMRMHMHRYGSRCTQHRMSSASRFVSLVTCQEYDAAQGCGTSWSRAKSIMPRLLIAVRGRRMWRCGIAVRNRDVIRVT